MGRAGRKARGRLLLAVMLGSAAVILLIVPGLQAYARAPLGFALGLRAGLGWAIGMVVLKRGKVMVNALVLTGWQLLIAAVPTTMGESERGREEIAQACGFGSLDAMERAIARASGHGMS